MNINYEQLTEDLISSFTVYHGLLDIPINGLIWENLLYASLKKQSNDVVWNYKSHQTGADINYENYSISCKGGRLQGSKKDRLKISSYRTTSYKTIEEKLEYFDENHEDVYFCMSYEETKNKHKYKLFTFDSDILDYKKLNWQKTKRGWKGEGKFLAKIESSMSDQLWLWLPIKILTKQFDICVEKNNKYGSINTIEHLV